VTTSEPRPAGIPGTDPTRGPLVGDPAGPAGTADPRPPGNGPATAPDTAQHGRGAGRALGRTVALALLIFVTVVLVLFVMFNTQTVDISLVFTDVEAPLVLALLIAAVLGGLLVGLADALMTVRRRRNR
jgi:uncharacterized integral membrane protein